MIYTIHQPYKMGIYCNVSRKTIAQIKKELEVKYGAEVVLCNLNLFDLGKFTGYCFTKAEGRIVGSDGYVYNVLAWNENDGKMTRTSSNQVDNYAHAFGCMEIIKNGKNCAPSNLDWASGYRQRTAIGIKDNNDIVIYCNQSNVSIASVITSLLAENCVYAINVDGGASSQCIMPNGTLNSSRAVHTLFYAVLQNPKNTPKEDCPYKEPIVNIKKGSKGEGAKWFQWFLDKLGYDIGATGVDGDFGSKSVSALMAFQKDANFLPKEIDGIGGKQSRVAIINAYNSKFNASHSASSQPIKDTAPITKTEYTVKFGDSWWGIAEKMLGSGSKMYDLAKLNGRTIKDSLKVGEVLTLSAQSAPKQEACVGKTKAEKMVDYAYEQLGSPYVYGSQGEDAGDKIIDWSARCFPSYTTAVRANRVKKYIKDNPMLNGKPVKVFDCSSLVLCALEAAGLKYADTTAAGIYCTLATPIKKSELRYGDIVLTEKLDHIGIVGYNGEIIEAAGSDIGVVKTSSVDDRVVKSIYGEKYGAYNYYQKSNWTKFGRIKEL